MSNVVRVEGGAPPVLRLVELTEPECRPEVREKPQDLTLTIQVGQGPPIRLAIDGIGARLGAMSPGAADTAGRTEAAESMVETIAEWRRSMERRGLAAKYIYQAERCVRQTGWATVLDFTARAAESFLSGLSVSATSQNRAHGYLSSFGSWCYRTERLSANPMERVPKARAFREHGNRAFSPAEAEAVIAAARRDGESAEPRFKARDRWVYYTVAWLTGLRRGELRLLRWEDVRLDETPPRLIVRGRNAKARKEQVVPLAPAAVAALRILAAKSDLRGLVFEHVHDRVVVADIEAAGVPRKIDGKTTGMHSFRHGLATELARKGIPEGVAMAVMRHSDPRLTRGVYMDARLLPIFDAVSAVTVAGCASAGKKSEKISCNPEKPCDTEGAETKPMRLATPHSEREIPGLSKAGASSQQRSLPATEGSESRGLQWAQQDSNLLGSEGVVGVIGGPVGGSSPKHAATFLRAQAAVMAALADMLDGGGR